LEALKSELKGSIEKGVSFASNGATVAVWSKLTQLFLQALLEATILLQVQLVVKRRSNMEQENINWLFFKPEFRHFFDFRANHEACWNFVQILSKVIISANCTCSGIHQKHEAFTCAVSVLMINNLLYFSVLSTVLLKINAHYGMHWSVTHLAVLRCTTIFGQYHSYCILLVQDPIVHMNITYVTYRTWQHDKSWCRIHILLIRSQ
jgi:hypothetical protein